MDQITIPTEGGDFHAYIARPAITPAPVVVVLHEIFGVNKDIRQTCRELASNGFIAIAPDLFWRQEADVDLNSWSEAEWKKGFELYTAFDRDIGIRDIVATMRAARELPEATGKVGLMGFCLGGLMTFLTVMRHTVDAAVAYHGAESETYLSEVGGIEAPLLMHLAEEDEFISKDAQAQIKAALANVPGAVVYSYADQNHAFARHTGAHYDAQAAALANGRTTVFLAEHLNLKT